MRLLGNLVYVCMYSMDFSSILVSLHHDLCFRVPSNFIVLLIVSFAHS